MGRHDPQKFIYEYLKNGTSVEMDVNGSSTSVDFKYTCGSNGEPAFEWARMNVVLIDTSMQYGKFGAQTLTNGCLLQVKNKSGAVLEDFGTDDVPIIAGEDFGGLSGGDNLIEPAAGNDSFPVRFSVFRAGDRMLLSRGDEIIFTVRDNLTGLAKFRIMIQGLKG